MRFTDYSHDRNANFKQSSDEIFELIENFSKEKKLDSFYDHYQKRYSIPLGVLKQSLKKNISQYYIYKSARFRNILKLSRIPISIIKYLGLLFLSLIFSRKNRFKNHYRLIIDEIDQELYLRRFSRIINLFGEDNVLVIDTGDLNVSEFPNHKIEKLSLYKNHDRHEILRTIYYELFFGFWICLKTSIALKTNLFQQSFFIIKTILQYKSLLKYNSADFLLQERLYTANAIKNHLFKASGGIATATMQKSILELCKMSYYIDIDYFFSLGNRTAERALDYGGRIQKVMPVGSLFMEYYWFSSQKSIEKNIDVLMLGMNIMNEYERFDKYNNFMNDYYGTIRWLARFKIKYPHYKIAIKHHASASDDKIENEIISGSGVQILPINENSYEFAFGSRCVVSYGSTMGYEMNAHGVSSFFPDPGNRCTFLPDADDNLIEGLRLSSFDEYENKLLSFLTSNRNDAIVSINQNDLCLESSEVSNTIYNHFKEVY